ncbi:MAG: magnesium chelatase domain-containing protein, partial [Chloroflexota bacterium]|jgi:magnesium chelatase family protein|nr:magnesium chelatase domain-containing protein [Chloroflexota bacterium]
VELRDERAIFLGELSLDGGVRHANGVLPMVAVCQEEGFDVAYVPLIDAREAGVVRDVTVLSVDSLQQLVAHYNGLIEIESHSEDLGKDRADGALADMKDIRG